MSVVHRLYRLDTYVKLIDTARNETHLILQRGYNHLYVSYRLSIDTFFNRLLSLNSRTYQRDVKIYVDELFQHILQISLTFNNINKPILPNYMSCLWKNRPFGNSPNLLINQLEVNLGKLFQLQDLLKLSHDLVQVLSVVSLADF